MIGHSRDGNGAESGIYYEAITRVSGVLLWSSALPCGHVMSHGGAEGQKGFGEQVASTRETGREKCDGVSRRGEGVGMGIPT